MNLKLSVMKSIYNSATPNNALQRTVTAGAASVAELGRSAAGKMKKRCTWLAFAALTPLAVVGWLSLISIGSAQERDHLPGKINLVPEFQELGFTVSKPGSYRLRILATAAPNFGTIRIALDGDARGPDFDLYSGRVCPSGSLELGSHELTAGKHSLRVTAVGKNAMSANYFIGLDAIDLIAAE